MNFVQNTINDIPFRLNVLVFRTDIKTSKKMKDVKHLFERYPTVKKWTVDTQDIDNVLRIEAPYYLLAQDIIDLLTTRGFYCDVLKN